MLNSFSPIRSQHGFTLIELMMAMVILGIGIISIVALQTQDMAYNNSSRRQTQSSTWAMDRIEQLRSVPYTDAQLTVGDHTENQGPYKVNWKVTNNAANVADTKKIVMTIQWNGRDISTTTFIRTESAI